MLIKHIKDFKKGWFVGNFEPSLIQTNNVEVAVKEYNIGDSEERHYHKKATEITVIVTGKVAMNGAIYNPGDVIIIEPYEDTDFHAVRNTICTVVKYPGVNDDKYVGVYKND